MPVAGCSRRAFPVRSPISRVVHSSRRVDREPGERACLAHLEAEEVLLDVVIYLPESYWKERLCRRLLRARAGFAADPSGFPVGLRRGCDPAPAARGAALGRLPEIPSRHRSPAGLPGALAPVCGSGGDVGRWQGVCPGCKLVRALGDEPAKLLVMPSHGHDCGGQVTQLLWSKRLRSRGGAGVVAAPGH